MANSIQHIVNQESEHRVVLSSRNQHERHSNRLPIEQRSDFEMWKSVYFLSCVYGLIFDPFILYTAFIDDGKKCIGFERKRGFTFIIVRLLADIPSIIDIVAQIWIAIKKAKSSDRLPELVDRRPLVLVRAIFANLFKIGLTSNIVCVLPIPQVLLAVNFILASHGDDKILANTLLGVQYLARVSRTFELVLSPKAADRIYGLFGFTLYLITSNIIGGLWYFYSIQREVSCWYQACTRTPGCKLTYYCHDTTSNNITLLTELCPINPSNASTFDFGIFLDALQSTTNRDTSFMVRVCTCFWWGLRNMSNFGTNLQTSSYIWETMFAVFISYFGLAFLTIVIGKVQMGMQSDDDFWRTKFLREQDLRAWTTKNGVPENVRVQIMRRMVKKLKDNGANTGNLTDLGNLFSILPSKTKRDMKRILCMSALTRVPRLEGMNVKVLEKMCDYMKPVVYAEDSWVVQLDEQLDRMILITKGTMLIYPPNTSTIDATSQAAGGAGGTSSSMIRKPSLKKGDFYGDDELLIWASSPDIHVTFANLPVSKENVKCHSKVEGFALTANDLKKVISKFNVYWNRNSSGEMVAHVGTMGVDNEESDSESEQSDHSDG